MTNFFKYLINFFFPKTCFGCEKILPNSENFLCVYCRHNLPILNFEDFNENKLKDIFFGIIDVDKVLSFLYFNKEGIVQNIIHSLKYRNNREIGIFLADLFYHKLDNKKLFEDIDIVTIVPLHNKKLVLRGYNQVEDFAKRISEKLNLKYRDDIIQRIKHEKSQTKKNKKQRYDRMKGVFSINKNNKKEIKGKRILLIDDVITTGATLEICCKEIQKYSENKISILSIAKAFF